MDGLGLTSHPGPLPEGERERKGKFVYLDNQATTPCDPRVVAAMLPFFTERFGNAHSAEHGMGQESEQAVEHARAQVAALIEAEPREVVFTSGATEANNLAIKGAARFAARQGSARRRVITVATEHKCVLESVADLAAEGFEPVVLPVAPDGLLDPATLAAALATPTVLVSVMAANNETGVLQDLPQLAAITRAAGALFHTDAAQALGKVSFRVAGIDLASFSAHKVYGPKGVGALYVRRRPRARLAPLFSGGGQERGLRSGTLPTALLVGFGAACALAAAEMPTEATRLATLRDRLLHGLAERLPGLQVNGTIAARLPGNLNVTLPGADALAVMRASPALCVSSGSACSSAEIAPSYVLAAMGLSPAQAARTLRVGLGRFTSAADVEYAITALSRAP
jgi:cysteine desulfurase